MDIQLAKQNNERVVKEWQCTSWGLIALYGRLAVTTERVIFYGTGGLSQDQTTGQYRNRIVQEVELSGVSGINTFYGTKINWIWFIIGLVLGFSGLTAFGTAISITEKMNDLYPHYTASGGVSALGIVGMLICIGGWIIFGALGFGKAFFLNIYANQSSPAIALGNRDRANLVLLSLSGKPTDKTDIMMRELGALIIDLKTDKEEAYEAWHIEPATPPTLPAPEAAPAEDAQPEAI